MVTALWCIGFVCVLLSACLSEAFDVLKGHVRELNELHKRVAALEHQPTERNYYDPGDDSAD